MSILLALQPTGARSRLGVVYSVVLGAASVVFVPFFRTRRVN